jgi:predicted ATPase
MDLALFSKKLQHYCRLTANSQKTLAHELGLHPSVLSHKLHGDVHRILTQAEVKAIIKILAKWEAITSQEEAVELLALVNCPSFTVQEWRTPPLNQLTAFRSAQQASSINSLESEGMNGSAEVSATAPSNHQQPVSRIKHNLPSQLSTFVGREKEKTEIRRLLLNTRLLTLTGAGGVGKTRLALEVGAAIQTGFEDGVWLVELAALTDPNFMPQAVGGVLGVREERAGTILAALTAYLAQKSLLLVLDNCEHLLSAAKKLAQNLLAACPRLRILATSREAFDIAGEHNYLVPSLSLPPAGLDLTHSPQEGAQLRQVLSRYEALELFIERAQASLQTFEVRNQNALTIIQICQQLDGIPLAIELAASKVWVLTLDQIADLLSDRFRLLKRSSEEHIPRHQTLYALLDWSYGLLTAREQAVLQRFSIFRGSWNLAGAEAICAAMTSEAQSEINIEKEEVLDLLIQLINKSLVVVVQPEAKDQSKREGYGAYGAVEPVLFRQEMRYRLLESVREYGLKKLTEQDDVALVKARHLDYFLDLAEKTDPELASGSGKQAGLAKLDLEIDNIRVALGWALDNRKWEKALRLGKALYHYWRNRGYWSEGRRWLELGLTEAGEGGEVLPATIRAGALYVAGQMAHYQSDMEGAKIHLEQCLVLWRELGDKRSLAYTLLNLSDVITSQGDHQRGAILDEECLELFREIGDKQGIAQMLDRQSIKLFEQGDYAGAERVTKEFLKLSRELSNKELIGAALWFLGLLASVKDVDKAKALFEKSLALFKGLGNKQGISNSLAMLGEIQLFQGDYVGAKPLLEESLTLGREIGLDTGWIIHNLNDLGYVEFFQGNYPGATSLFVDSLRMGKEEGNIRQIFKSLMGLASLNIEQGQVRVGASLFGAAAALREKKPFFISAIEKAGFANLVGKARTVSDEATFNSAWEEGQAKELSEVIENTPELEFY